MKTVKSAKKKVAVKRASDPPYAIDDCLPQRQAIDSGKVGFHALTHGHYPGVRISEKLLAGVKSLGFFDVIGAQDWGIPLHRNEGIEICYQQTGESVLVVDGAGHHMRPKSLSLTRPWQLHSVGDPNLLPGRLHWLILDVGVRRPNQTWTLPDWCVLTESDQKELIHKLRGNEHPVWTATVAMKSIFSDIASLVDSDCPEANLSSIRIRLNDLLCELLSLFRAENIEVDDALMSRRRVVKLFLNELQSDASLMSQPWTLDSMAASCGMKRTMFSDYCRDLLNTSPLEALNSWRLELAAHRLRHELEVSITTIALDVGYSSSQYFSRKFKQRFGMSPRLWRDGLRGGPDGRQ